MFNKIASERLESQREVAELFGHQINPLKDTLTKLYFKLDKSVSYDKHFSYNWWKNFLITEQVFNIFNAISCLESGDLVGCLYQLRRIREGNAIALFVKKHKNNSDLIRNLMIAFQLGDEQGKLDYLLKPEFQMLGYGLVCKNFDKKPLEWQQYFLISKMVEQSTRRKPKEFNWPAHFNFGCHYMKTFSKAGKQYYSFAVPTDEKGVFENSGTKNRYEEIIEVMKHEFDLTLKRFNNF